MAKNKKIDFDSLFSEIKDKVTLSEGLSDTEKVPDIIDFCYSKRFLNFKQQNISLFKTQSIILKAFYRGQPNNEHLELTEDEIQWLSENNHEAVVKKYLSDAIFRDLVLVAGRRSGKDFLVSILALYEALRLLECPGGDPCAYYQIGPGTPIFILMVANSADQAQVLFAEIRSKLKQSEYFRTRIGSIESDRFYLLTPADRKFNAQMDADDMSDAKTKGSVVILSGHSNADSLLGKSVFTLLLDEVASYRTSGNAYSGDKTYSLLAPATATFIRPDASGPNGEPIYDSKIVSISSPRAESGILWRLWKESDLTENRMAFKLPTWKVNPRFTQESLRKEFRFMSDMQFSMEFGAEFAGSSGEKFIADDYVDEAIRMGIELNLQQRIVGQRGISYYAHLDPATTSHNYALVVLHTEDRVRTIEKENGRREKEHFKLYVVDHIKFWTPSIKKWININEIDEYIINLSKTFRFASVSYDDCHSISSIQKLRAVSIPTRLTPFRSSYKQMIYDTMENLFVNKQIALPGKGPYASLLEQELKCLKRIFTERGFKIKPDPDAMVKTDDVADALAGAIGSASSVEYKGMIKSSRVYMPMGMSGQQMWSIGSGLYGNDQLRFLDKFGKF